MSFDMGVPTVGAPRKDYRVCWSDAPVTVGDPSSYKVEVSAASQLKGPNVEATEEDAIACTLGEECSLTVTGVDIATTSRVAILRPCQAPQPTPFWHHWRRERARFRHFC